MEEARDSPCSPGQGAKPSSMSAWLLGIFAAAVIGTLLVRRVPDACYSGNPRLDRPARAVANARPVRPGVVPVQGSGVIAVVPLGLQFDREDAVALALELQGLGSHSAGGATTDIPQTAGLSPADRFADFLALDPETAGILLYALGLPSQAASGNAAPEAGKIASALFSLPGDRLARLFKAAQDAVAWPAAEEALRSRFGLSAEQVTAVRAELCREAVARAFLSRRGLERASEALAKYADLAPAQAETVLAMAGALELLRAGNQAIPVLKGMAGERPRLAALLLNAVSARAQVPAEP